VFVYDYMFFSVLISPKFKLRIFLANLYEYLRCIAVSILLSSCGLIQAQVLSGSVYVRHQDVSLTLTMEIDSTISEGERWMANFQIRNNGLSVVSLLPWGTPWEGAFSRSLFSIESAGHIIEYIGPMIKRRAPSPLDYIDIRPGMSRLVELDISSAYSLENNGDYKLRYLPGSLALINQGQGLVVAVPHMATMKVQVAQNR
jgi:hypothetical protein